MNQKNITRAILIIIALAVIAMISYFIFVRTVQAPSETDSETPDKPTNFSTTIDGYAPSCANSTTLSKNINGSWEKVSNNLPPKGLYYLDDKFVGYGSCDKSVCSTLPKPYIVNLVEYQSIGAKTPPANSNSTAKSVPAFQTIPLQGDIKIDIQYFSDNNCQNKKTFSTVVKR